ncbi:type II toxin-antitoxin system RelE/ParE family toxin [Cognatishimia sp. SS12]|uniref:type II toxin-antitoxin system RelE/ParE family toxin n=1 Tax=Cognatishimia sp. SS12 TaxID=2979465 RepID=UPI002330AAF7|nr:type II toxin-antitoxin system RelE/ParE family toxin [Cognatishimia sp. SS12]MDC0738497.1 type II toxin-antitoxin system RelE/ParE family toxin [Cognatishimia sp. SS12]
MTIQSVKGKRVRNAIRGNLKGLPSDLTKRIKALLIVLDSAKDLTDLRSPPGNQLETLKGDRAGQHSIRINGQWRICFVWTENGPADVEIVDYH